MKKAEKEIHNQKTDLADEKKEAFDEQEEVITEIKKIGFARYAEMMHNL